MGVGAEVEASAVSQGVAIAGQQLNKEQLFYAEIQAKIQAYKTKVTAFLAQNEKNINQRVFQSTIQALNYKGKSETIYGNYEKDRNAAINWALSNSEELKAENILREGYSLIMGIRQNVANRLGKDGNISYMIAYPAPGGSTAISGVLTEEEYLNTVSYNEETLSLQLTGLLKINWANKKVTITPNEGRYRELQQMTRDGEQIFKEDKNLTKIMEILQNKKYVQTLKVLRKNRKKGKKRRSSKAVRKLSKGRQFEIAEEFIQYFYSSQGEQLREALQINTMDIRQIEDDKLALAISSLLPTNTQTEGPDKIDVFDNLAFYRGGDVGNYQLKYIQYSANKTTLMTILNGLNEILTGIHMKQKFLNDGETARNIGNSTMAARIRAANIDNSISQFAQQYVAQILGL